MKKRSRLLAMILAGTMLASLLAGCGGKPDGATTKPSGPPATLISIAKAQSIALDVTDTAQTDAVLAAIAKEFGAITILANNAGISGTPPDIDRHIR